MRKNSVAFRSAKVLLLYFRGAKGDCSKLSRSQRRRFGEAVVHAFRSLAQILTLINPPTPSVQWDLFRRETTEPTALVAGFTRPGVATVGRKRDFGDLVVFT